MPEEATVKGQLCEFQYLVLRPFTWDNFKQTDEFGNTIPLHIVFPGGETPGFWLPLFTDREDALSCAEGGRYAVVMLRRSTIETGRLPVGFPDACPQCGVIHWSACPFESKEENAVPPSA